MKTKTEKTEKTEKAGIAEKIRADSGVVEKEKEDEKEVEKEVEKVLCVEGLVSLSVSDGEDILIGEKFSTFFFLAFKKIAAVFFSWQSLKC